ncbi:hypothetical protein KHF85_10000 [Xanthomonas translucens pv. graminis]|uniref:hypothetical protein n=1 Tax=Xanthomonas graminis TaxID=3390026 RepID=UPI00254235B5|nr:hypothetical protein [Xanthomonas translucens]WIH06685.1 hypothetical protein KHF85_10000 [Xanthomonas translucens pv. graminis]
MSCDDLTCAHETPPAALHPVAGLAASGRPVAARRQPGSALRQLEMRAQDELRQMLGRRGPVARSDSIADLVWAGLSWDMGLNGAAIAAAGTPAPLPGYAALADHD